MFTRLFRYAKGDPNVALENFTTEALRTAIEDDPIPMIRALRQTAPPKPGGGCLEARLARVQDLLEGVVGLIPHTQVSIPGTGTIDLLLEATGTSRPAEIWLEVKAGASETRSVDPEDPGQLTRYRDHLVRSSSRDGIRSSLLTLSDTAFDCTAWLSWARLWAVVRSSPEVSRTWLDLLSFLKEQNVTDESLMPITAREASALGDASRLLAKASKILAEVHAQGSAQWGTLFGWYQPNQVKNSLYAPFVGSGALKLSVGWTGDVAYIYTGLVDQDGEAHWSVSIEMVKRSPVARAQLLTQAQGLAPDTWTTREVGDTVTSSAERAAALYEGRQAVEWLMERLADLATAGIMDTIAQSNPDEPRRQGRVAASTALATGEIATQPT
jgi:hypothetical protein